MIDPLISLAFALHSQKGVYALLVGSGISRSAQIPTGWEIILDLTRKLARTVGENADTDPESWYRERFGEEPNYSKLLGSLAKTPAERQQLLRAYFEPDEEDREQRRKQPTAAHQAIAELVAGGHLRVVVTPNFDRLLEQSLEAQGIVPTVISTPDAVDGAIPITHSRCTIIKVHGDYLDTRIKNTPEELSEYDPRLNLLLDRVLDEFGLVICGWSAEWDFSLADVFRRSKSRRYTTYWAAHGELGERAQGLVQLRGAQVIPITGADQFLGSLSEKVAAIEEFSQPHPLSAPIAVASLKRYLTDSKHRIRLEDLVASETERLVAELTDERFPYFSEVTEAPFVTRVHQYEALTEVLRDLLAAGCYWGEEAHRGLWARSIGRVALLREQQGGRQGWLKLQAYPALILLYGAGLASIARNDYGTLTALFIGGRVVGQNGEQPLAAVLNAITVHTGKPDGWDWVIGGRRYTPASDHLFEHLRDPVRRYLPEDAAYLRAFDRLEYLLALTYADLHGGDWIPVGAFAWRGRWDLHSNVQDCIDAEAQAAGEQWAPLVAGLFGGSLERFKSARDRAREFLKGLHWS